MSRSLRWTPSLPPLLLNCVHLGVGGVYYRRRGADDHGGRGRPAQPGATADDVLSALERARRQPRWLTLAAGAALAVALPPAALAFAGRPASALAWGAADVVALGLLGAGWWLERRLGTVALQYRFDADDRRRWEALVESFAALADAAMWQVTTRGEADDPKYHAATSRALDRRAVRPSIGLPPSVASNVLVPALPTVAGTLWFFPDRLVLYGRDGVTAVPYPEVEIESRTTQFVERDGEGGPGAVHRHVPISVYGRLELRPGARPAVTFLAAQPDALARFAAALDDLRRHAGEPAAERRRRSEAEHLLRRLADAEALVGPYTDAMQAEDWQSACDAATRLEELLPIALPVYWRGASLARLGRWAEAERDLLRAWEQRDDPCAWVDRQAAVLDDDAQRRAFDAAAARWRALALPVARLCRDLALVCGRTGRPDDARAWAERAVEHGDLDVEAAARGA